MNVKQKYFVSIAIMYFSIYLIQNTMSIVIFFYYLEYRKTNSKFEKNN